jgi:uroporphyrinogen decarboxylase
MINIKTDPNFDRIKNTLFLKEKADRTPLFDFNIARNIKEYVIGKKVTNPQDEVNFWIGAGYDYIQLTPLLTVKELLGKGVNEHTGLITNYKSFKENVYSWQKVLCGDCDDEKYGYDWMKQVSKVMPSSMKIILHVADVYTMAWELMGFNDFCINLVEDEKFVDELISQMGTYVDILLRKGLSLLGDKVGAIFYSDDIAYTGGLMLSPDALRKYLFPWIEKYASYAKERNIPFIYHTDGQLYQVLDDFRRIGVNGIQPLEPKSMDHSYLKREFGKEFCLMGAIDLDMMSRGTVEEVDMYVEKKIHEIGYNGGYCCGISNTVPYYINPENYKAMIEKVFSTKI